MRWPSPSFCGGLEREHLAADEGAHHVVVPLEPAACEHDTLVGADQLGGVVVLDEHARRPRRRRRRDRARRCPSRSRRLASSRPFRSDGDERRAAAPDVVGLAAHDQVEVGRLVAAQVLGALLHREPREVRAGASAIGPLTQLGAGVVGHRLDGAAGRLAAGDALEVVVERRRCVEAQRGLRLEVLDHVGRGVDVELDERGIGLAAVRETADVGEGLLTRVRHTDIGHVVVQRDPGHPARHARRAADQVGFLERAARWRRRRAPRWPRSARPRPTPARPRRPGGPTAAVTTRSQRLPLVVGVHGWVRAQRTGQSPQGERSMPRSCIRPTSRSGSIDWLGQW